MQLVIEFIRGPRDGEVLISQAGCEALDEATALYQTLNADLSEDSVWTTTEYAVSILGSRKMATIQSAIAIGCRFPGHVYQLAAHSVTVDWGECTWRTTATVRGVRCHHASRKSRRLMSLRGSTGGSDNRVSPNGARFHPDT